MASTSDPNCTKKSKGRYVPSRYKQSAEKYSNSNCSDETSTALYLTRNPVLCSTITDKTKISKNSLKKTQSTPELAGALRPNFDESAIPSASCTIMPKADRLRQITPTSSLKKALSVKGKTQKNLSSNVTLYGKQTAKRSKNGLNKGFTELEAELDICYAQYQLNLLLENKARKSLQDKSRIALGKIYEVFCYVQILLGKHESLKKSLNVVSFLLELHEHLQKQEIMLSPCLDIVDVLEKQYQEIASAVDCVRHKLLVEEVLPIDGSEEKIIELVNNIDNYLNLILTSVGNVEELITSADSASTFIKKGKMTCDEIKRGLELLQETRSLMLSETSLKFASLCCDEEA